MKDLKQEMLTSDKWVYHTFSEYSCYGKLETLVEQLWEEITDTECNYPCKINVKLKNISTHNIEKTIKETLINHIISVILEHEVFEFNYQIIEDEDGDTEIVDYETIRYRPDLSYEQLNRYATKWE